MLTYKEFRKKLLTELEQRGIKILLWRNPDIQKRNYMHVQA